MPRLFVLMPFDDDLQQVYERLFRAPFQDAGYEVSRADDITSHRNILADIVQSIQHSDLILADLTLSNPNVYYELGIAHTLKKPVVLVAQNVASVPFDLQSYRVVGYSVHFAKMEESIRGMRELAKKILAGKVQFANPVTDFADPGTSGERRSADVETSDEEDDEDEQPAGILDLHADLEENTNALAQLVRDSSRRLEAMNSRLREANQRITGVELGQPQRQRRTVRRLGASLKEDAKWFESFNTEYCDVLAEVESCFVGIFGVGRRLEEQDRGAVMEFVEIAEATQSQIGKAVESFTGLLQSIGELPRIERTFDRGRSLLGAEVDTYIDNLELSNAVMSRAQNLAKTMLRA